MKHKDNYKYGRFYLKINGKQAESSTTKKIKSKKTKIIFKKKKKSTQKKTKQNKSQISLTFTFRIAKVQSRLSQIKT